MSDTSLRDLKKLKGIDLFSEKDERIMRDDKWVEGINRDDKKSFEAIYKCYYPQLFNYLLRYLKSESTIEDVIQGVFFKVWQNRKTIEPRGTLKSYLFTAVRNEALKQIKSCKHLEMNRIDVSDEDLKVFDNPENTYERNELEEAYQNAVHKIPEKRREIFLMHRQYHLTYREIANILNISIKTVETQMRRTLKYLNIELAQYR